MQHESLPTESVSAALLHRQFLSSIPQIDQNVLNDIEIEAQYLAANIDNITENLYSLLHSVRRTASNFLKKSIVFSYLNNLFIVDIFDCCR